jgi:hypothetical protein
MRAKERKRREGEKAREVFYGFAGVISIYVNME